MITTSALDAFSTASPGTRFLLPSAASPQVDLLSPSPFSASAPPGKPLEPAKIHVLSLVIDVHGAYLPAWLVSPLAAWLAISPQKLQSWFKTRRRKIKKKEGEKRLLLKKARVVVDKVEKTNEMLPSPWSDTSPVDPPVLLTLHPYPQADLGEVVEQPRDLCIDPRLLLLDTFPDSPLTPSLSRDPDFLQLKRLITQDASQSPPDLSCDMSLTSACTTESGSADAMDWTRLTWTHDQDYSVFDFSSPEPRLETSTPSVASPSCRTSSPTFLSRSRSRSKTQLEGRRGSSLICRDRDVVVNGVRRRREGSSAGPWSADEQLARPGQSRGGKKRRLL